MKMPYYILHGLEGFPEENWFPWLKSKLEAKGEIVIVPEFPNSSHPQLSEWMETLKQEVAEHGEGIMTGHSLGGVLAMRYLQQGGFPYKIILVATPYAQLSDIPQISNFLERPPHFKDIDKETLQRVDFQVIHSDDDPYVPAHHAKAWGELLGVEPILLHGKRHINSQEFPEILEYL